MISLMDLWLPVLLSAVLVFVVSSILHMVLQYHKSDYAKLPGDRRLLRLAVAAGVEQIGVGARLYTSTKGSGPTVYRGEVQS